MKRRPASYPHAVLRLVLMAILPLAGLVACGDSGTESEAEPIEGTWTTTQGLTYYIRITTSTVAVYEGDDGVCYNGRILDIVSRSGDQVTLQGSESSTTFQVTIRRDGDQLRASGLESSELVLDPSTRDVSGLEQCQIQGSWGFTDGDFGSFVLITDSTFTAFDGLLDGCRDVFDFTLTHEGGDDYTLTDAVGSELNVRIRNEVGTMTVTFSGGGSLTYGSSSDDPTNFDLCGGGDDVTTACGDLPAIQVGESIQGELTTTDSLSVYDPGTGEGWYFDLYGLTLGSQQQVQIDHQSDAVDTYLRLWSADGAYVAHNDDNATSLNSTIPITLAAGCYRIEATTFGFGETGTYTLSVD